MSNNHDHLRSIREKALAARERAMTTRKAAAAQLERFDEALGRPFSFVPAPIARATAWLATATCHASTVLWLVPFIALAVLFIFLARQGLLICSTEALDQVVKVICAGILVALFREPILNVLDGLGRSKDARTHLAGLVLELLRAIVALTTCTICAVIAVTASSKGIVAEMPARAISAQVRATLTPVALRLTQGTSTRPATGSQTRPSRL